MADCRPGCLCSPQVIHFNNGTTRVQYQLYFTQSYLHTTVSDNSWRAVPPSASVHLSHIPRVHVVDMQPSYISAVTNTSYGYKSQNKLPKTWSTNSAVLLKTINSSTTVRMFKNTRKAAALGAVLALIASTVSAAPTDTSPSKYLLRREDLPLGFQRSPPVESTSDSRYQCMSDQNFMPIKEDFDLLVDKISLRKHWNPTVPNGDDTTFELNLPHPGCILIEVANTARVWACSAGQDHRNPDPAIDPINMFYSDLWEAMQTLRNSKICQKAWTFPLINLGGLVAMNVAELKKGQNGQYLMVDSVNAPAPPIVVF